MPEPEEDVIVENRTSKIQILEFFKTSVKETKKDKSKPLTKIMIRRLPPRLSKDGFLEAFNLPPHDYFCLVRGDLSLGVHAFSRAYINLLNPSDTFAFKEKYDDSEIRDVQGKEYHAVVEWAPVQRIPKKNSQKKKMPKCGTIESDPKYIEFLEKLEEEKNSQSNTSEYFHETEISSSKEEKITTTPLLEYIKLKRQKKIDMRNELRQKRRDAEKERRRKEDELRKTEKSKTAKEEKETKNRKCEDSDEKKNECSEVSDVIDEKNERKKKIVDPLPVVTEAVDIKIALKVQSEKGEKSEIRAPRKEGRPPKREREARKFSENVSQAKEKVKEAPEFVKDRNDEKISKSYSSRRSTPVEHRKSEPAPFARRTEPKSKFRYSEQRKDREVRSQTSEADSTEGKLSESDEKVASSAINLQKEDTDTPQDSVKEGRSSTKVQTSPVKHQQKKREREPGSGKDPRSERRIRNKDRPSLEIYRPGMGKFSKQRIDLKKDDNDTSPPPTSNKDSPEPEDILDKLSTCSSK